jgi:hypothetical protein
MDLLPEILKEDRVHGSFQPDVQGWDFAFHPGDDRDPLKLHRLVKARHMLLIAGDAVQPFFSAKAWQIRTWSSIDASRWLSEL